MLIRNPIADSRFSRRAFTLIEMLVVIAIMLALMGMVLLFYPKRDVRAAAQGAEQLQTYIASAKSRALRDRSPRGVRLLTQDGGISFREFQFIEVPEPFAPPIGSAISINPTVANPPFPANPLNTVTINYDLSGAVAVGDMLEITIDTNSPHRINGIATSAAGVTTLTLVTAPKIAQTTGYFDNQHYRFIRQPRPLLGEPTLHLPKNVYVHGSGNGLWPSSLNIPASFDGTNADIIFSASGEIINAIGGRVVLVVADDNNVSVPTLLSINGHTGGVSSNPKGPAGSEYIYTQDGKSSGQ